MEDWYVYSGTSNAGQNRLWQHKFREFFVPPATPVYTPVDYIVSTGFQYIDTGFKHNNNTRIVAKIEYCSVSPGGWYYPFGSFGGTSGTNKLLCPQISPTNTLQAYYGGTFYDFNIDCNGVHTYDFNKNVQRIDNITYTYTSTTFQSDYNFIIFGHTAYSGAIGITPIATKLYYFQIYDNGTLVRDYIPVLDENGVACLYDQVNEVFYYNQGTGEFYTNNDGYVTVQNIESSGTQYIDTGYTLSTSKLKIQFKIYTADMPTTEQDLASNQDGTTSRFVLGLYQNKVFGYSRSSNTYDTNVYSATYSGAQTLDIEANYDYGNSTKSLTVNTLTTTGVQNATINNSNQTIKILYSSVGESAYFVGKCYYCKIWDNDTLVRDFIPVLKNSTSEFGMYDNVSQTFFANDGTNNFVFRKI